MPWHERPSTGRRDWLTLVRRRGWVVALAVVVVTATAFIVSQLQTSVYEARARVLADPPNILGSSRPPAGERSSTETEAQILVSEPVQTLVRNRIGEAPAVIGEPVGSSQAMDVVAESTERARAAEVANTYASAYVDYRRQQTSDRLLSATRDVGAKVDELTRQIDGLGTTDARRPALLSQLGVFRSQLDQLQVDAALVGGGPQVLVRALEPADPIRPATGRNTAVGAAVGLLFGLLLALVLERLDDSVTTPADVRRAAPDVPVLGVVDGPDSYPLVRASLGSVASDRPLRSLLVTATGAGGTGAGTSAIAAQLARALARAGYDVVAVDGNLRWPGLHSYFGLENTVGFTSVVSGDVPLSAALRRVPDDERLGLLPSGPAPPQTTDLLASRRAGEVVAALVAQSDWVVVDGPAMDDGTDAGVLARGVDGVVLVVTAGGTTGGEITAALALLEPVQRLVAGIVVDASGVGRGGRGPSPEPARPVLRPSAGNGNGADERESATIAKGAEPAQHHRGTPGG